MKKFMVVLAILLVPAIAMAGMSAMSKKDLQTVKGQTGITFVMTTTGTTVGSAGWGDSDGYGTISSTAGWLTLADITLPTINIGATIDVATLAATEPGYVLSGGHLDHALVIHTMGPLVSGDLVIGHTYVGAAYGAGEDLGELRVSDVTLGATTIYVGGH